MFVESQLAPMSVMEAKHVRDGPAALQMIWPSIGARSSTLRSQVIFCNFPRGPLFHQGTSGEYTCLSEGAQTREGKGSRRGQYASKLYFTKNEINE